MVAFRILRIATAEKSSNYKEELKCMNDFFHNFSQENSFDVAMIFWNRFNLKQTATNDVWI